MTPPARRALVAAVGALFAGAVGLAVVALGWHFPSDVVGGYFVAIAGATLGLAFASRPAARAARRGRWRPARG